MSSWLSHWPYIVVVHDDVGIEDNYPVWLKFGEQIRTWMAETYPTLKRSDWNDAGDWTMSGFANGYDVAFRDPTVAALFKLAWGGK